MPKGIFARKPFTKEHRLKISKAHLGFRHTEETKKKISLNSAVKKGEKNPLWKGNQIGYSGLHSWLINNFGKATHCSNNITHKAKKYDWANISRKYKRDIHDFKQLCRKCHI